MCGAEDFRDRVARDLEQIATLREQGEAGGAERMAAELKAQIDRQLPADDPDRWRIDLVLNDLQFRSALLRGDEAEFQRLGVGAARAVEAASCPLPPGDPTRVQAVANLALYLVRSGQPEEALGAYERVATDARKQTDRNARRLVEALMMIAHLRLELDRDGEEAAARLVAAASHHLPPDDPFAVDVQRFVASRIWLPMHQRALEEVGAGNAEAGERRLQAELQRFAETMMRVGTAPSWISWGDLQLLKLRWEAQRLAAALETFESLDRAVNDADGPPLFFELLYRLARGLIESEQGNYVRAREEYERAIDLGRRGGPGLLWETAQAQAQLGLLMLRQGDYRAAREQLQRARDAYASSEARKASSEHAHILTNLAKTYEWTGDLGLAELLHRQAVDQSEGADPYTRCLCRNNLAMQRYAAGDFDEARSELERARVIAAEELEQGNHRIAEIDVNLAWVALEHGDLEEAGQRFGTALELFEQRLGATHHRYAEVLGYRGLVLARQGQVEEAREVLELAMDLRREALERMLRSSLSERERLAYIQALRAHPESKGWPGVLDAYLSLASELRIPAADQYARLLAWKGAIDRHATPGPEQLEDDPEIRDLAVRREQSLRLLRAEAQTGPGADDARTHPARLAELAGQVEALERSLRGRSRRFAEATASAEEPPEPAEVAAALPEGSALFDVIEVLSFGDRQPGEPLAEPRRYVGFLVCAGRPIQRIDLGDATTLDRDARRFLRALDLGGETDEPAARLAERLRDPIAPHLDEVDLLVFAGDGLLQQIPLAALPGPEGESFWVESLAFASVPSAEALLKASGRTAQADGALVVGAVDYGPLAGRYPPLEATRAEIEAVAETFRQRSPQTPLTVKVGAEASEATIRQLLPQHRYIHLATHGFFRGTDEDLGRFDATDVRARLDSGLVFAAGSGSRLDDPAGEASPGGFDPDDDQVLTAEELGWLDLGGVDLVVLSACSTGLGHIRAGQGLVGLLGALDRAGVGAVVCSLWEVDDEPTAALMAAFYRHLWDDDEQPDPARALRAAQLELIRDPGASTTGIPLAHPRSWSAFILSGNPFP